MQIFWMTRNKNSDGKDFEFLTHIWKTFEIQQKLDTQLRVLVKYCYIICLMIRVSTLYMLN